jgi:hypothetical protein
MPTSTFKLGDTINYVSQVTNTTSSAVNATAIVTVTPPGAKVGIVSGISPQTIPAGGVANLSTSATIPFNARLGQYQVTITAIEDGQRDQASTTYQVQAC